MGEWRRVHDLHDEPERLRVMQQWSWEHPGGMAPEPHVIGSPGWWRALDTGELEVIEVEGEIVRTYAEPLFDGDETGWPLFVVRATDGTETTWTADGEASDYRVGDRVRLRHTWTRAKATTVVDEARGRLLPVVLTIDVASGPRTGLATPRLTGDNRRHV